MKTADRYDRLAVGLAAGLLLPVLVFLVSGLILSEGSLSQYIERFQQLNRVSSLISLSAIPNLLLFFLFLWKNRYRSARGVIFATLILAFVMLIVKFL
jgi:cytochrome bd-type quinol oxidase subunit 2